MIGPAWAPALVPAAVLLPLAAAVLVVVVPSPARRVVGLVAAALTAAAGIAVAALVISHGPLVVSLGGHRPPLGISLRADGLSAVFLLLSAVVGGVVSVHAAVHPPSTGVAGSRDWFWPAWLLAWSGLAAVFVSGDLFNLYVALEIVGLAAVLLVALGGPDAWRAAFRYLIVAVAGSLLFLLALTLVYSATGTLDLALAGSRLAEPDAGPLRTAVLALTMAGMALKSALFPLHGWLPGAHGDAPAAVSPILSGLVVKASFVVTIRVWSDVTGPVPGVAAVIGVAAAGSILWAGLVALRATGFKQLVAYSTVSQVGYLFLFFPLSAAAAREGMPATAALGAVVTLAVAHGLAKSALFLAAGMFKEHVGNGRIDSLAGRGAELPVVTMAIGICAVGLAGLPVTLGFAGKWQLLSAAVGVQAWWVVAVVAAGTLVAAGYLLRPLQSLLTGASEDGIDSAPDRPHSPLPRLVTVLPLLLALVTVGATFAAVPLAELAIVGQTPGGPR
ncbi:complex I subunit 5 family protein [Dietzia natronolimnaea]|uniref:complex I subunit 5 family protein n=1 Tax=Dietzia natronolimnaea TaxID=161920 RepID=UPI0031F93C4C